MDAPQFQWQRAASHGSVLSAPARHAVTDVPFGDGPKSSEKATSVAFAQRSFSLRFVDPHLEDLFAIFFSHHRKSLLWCWTICFCIALPTGIPSMSRSVTANLAVATVGIGCVLWFVVIGLSYILYMQYKRSLERLPENSVLLQATAEEHRWLLARGSKRRMLVWNAKAQQVLSGLAVIAGLIYASYTYPARRKSCDEPVSCTYKVDVDAIFLFFFPTTVVISPVRIVHLGPLLSLVSFVFFAVRFIPGSLEVNTDVFASFAIVVASTLVLTVATAFAYETRRRSDFEAIYRHHLNVQVMAESRDYVNRVVGYNIPPEVAKRMIRGETVHEVCEDSAVAVFALHRFYAEASMWGPAEIVVRLQWLATTLDKIKAAHPFVLKFHALGDHYVAVCGPFMDGMLKTSAKPHHFQAHTQPFIGSTSTPRPQPLTSSFAELGPNPIGGAAPPSTPLLVAHDSVSWRRRIVAETMMEFVSAALSAMSSSDVSTIGAPDSGTLGYYPPWSIARNPLKTPLPHESIDEQRAIRLENGPGASVDRVDIVCAVDFGPTVTMFSAQNTDYVIAGQPVDRCRRALRDMPALFGGGEAGGGAALTHQVASDAGPPPSRSRVVHSASSSRATMSQSRERDRSRITRDDDDFAAQDGESDVLCSHASASLPVRATLVLSHASVLAIPFVGALTATATVGSKVAHPHPLCCGSAWSMLSFSSARADDWRRFVEADRAHRQEANRNGAVHYHNGLSASSAPSGRVEKMPGVVSRLSLRRATAADGQPTTDALLDVESPVLEAQPITELEQPPMEAFTSPIVPASIANVNDDDDDDELLVHHLPVSMAAASSNLDDVPSRKVSEVQFTVLQSVQKIVEETRTESHHPFHLAFARDDIEARYAAHLDQLALSKPFFVWHFFTCSVMSIVLLVVAAIYRSSSVGGTNPTFGLLGTALGIDCASLIYFGCFAQQQPEKTLEPQRQQKGLPAAPVDATAAVTSSSSANTCRQRVLGGALFALHCALWHAAMALDSTEESLLRNEQLLWAIVVLLLALLRPSYHHFAIQSLLDAGVLLPFVVRVVISDSHSTKMKGYLTAGIVILWLVGFVCRALQDQEWRSHFCAQVQSEAYRSELERDYVTMEELLLAMVPHRIADKLMEHARNRSDVQRCIQLQSASGNSDGVGVAAVRRLQPHVPSLFTMRTLDTPIVIARLRIRGSDTVTADALEHAKSTTSGHSDSSASTTSTSPEPLLSAWKLLQQLLQANPSITKVKFTGDLCLLSDEAHAFDDKFSPLLHFASRLLFVMREVAPHVVCHCVAHSGPLMGAVLGSLAVTYEYYGEACSTATELMDALPADMSCMVMTERFGWQHHVATRPSDRILPTSDLCLLEEDTLRDRSGLDPRSIGSKHDWVKKLLVPAPQPASPSHDDRSTLCSNSDPETMPALPVRISTKQRFKLRGRVVPVYARYVHVMDPPLPASY